MEGTVEAGAMSTAATVPVMGTAGAGEKEAACMSGEPTAAEITVEWGATRPDPLTGEVKLAEPATTS